MTNEKYLFVMPRLLVDQFHVDIVSDGQVHSGGLGHSLSVLLIKCEHWARVERQKCLFLTFVIQRKKNEGISQHDRHHLPKVSRATLRTLW